MPPFCKVDGLPPHGKLSLSRIGLGDTFMRITVERNIRSTPLPGAMVSARTRVTKVSHPPRRERSERYESVAPAASGALR
eukprot:1185539-Prorocentrum_minimum.AAC.2